MADHIDSDNWVSDRSTPIIKMVHFSFIPHYVLFSSTAMFLMSGNRYLCVARRYSDADQLFTRSPSSYCQPAEPCWPSPQEWQSFNMSVKGRLISVQPEGTPCYTEGPTSPACVAIVGNWTNPYWRSAQPGAMQDPIWEEDDEGNSCFNSMQPCAQGRVPPYAVAVQEVADISSALSFAIQYNIRVVIKTSGHELQGRSTAAGALLIWMYNYKDIQVIENYIACSGDRSVPAVNVTGGAAWGEVYAAVAPKYGVVGGSARTVAACGGYTLGGGHSYMSPAYGLAVDNVLAFSAVLANGTFVIASACSHPDLFWALRGGGGGTFAVITSAVYLLHPTPAEGVTGYYASIALLRNTTSVSLLLDGFLSATPNLLSPNQTGGVWGGYFFLGMSTFTAIFVYNGTLPAAQASLLPLQEFMASNPTDFLVSASQFFPAASMNDWHNIIDTGDPTGTPLTVGSRLVPLSACTDSAQRAIAVTAITALAAQVTVEGNLVAGGAVAAFDRASTHTSVTPAWRDAVWHVTFGGTCNLTCSIDETLAVFYEVADLSGMIRAAFPDSGAYWSESDYNEPDWQQSFWGSTNYIRLQHIKQQYDPQGIFECHHCVTLPD
ncbi:hypothetical protein EMCRGX_G033115 [Ephydatia muelleri]